ncbi:sphingosine-1-phosphate phosphatase 1-like [Venturia canescens]|uniref:sphingosine-1-phosphate phosphatase 1-like n=1 Tax=Venturia canescens TaxID=32260 RepID=UPI001C9C5DCC|nr:sphingosine-1-phosphate phosphatase 1-like [Venturia canescens]XP_043266799.1 sphingosine-1-phosphate phosphatase 1-like [Venturia canescens]
MIKETIDYLKDPHLVARIQEFFGIRIHYAKESQNIEEKECTDECKRTEKRRNGYTDGKINGSCKFDYCKEEKQKNLPSDAENSVESESLNYTITNYFWYYLFLFGTELGDETFYCAFIPFWFWNIDGAVGRRVVLVWAIIMTIGQAMKDIIRWPRPSCPPATRLQSKWSQEYGMPSTHAMIGMSIPFSVILFTMNRYIYSFTVGCTIATIWCILVFTSRLYLGMHTVLDIVVGLSLAIILMIPLIPLVDFTDYYFLTESWAIGALIALTIITIVYYPQSDRWTPTRGDTAMVVSVTAGVYVGAWLNYKTGALSAPLLPPPYNIIWPSCPMFGRMTLRTIIGFCCVIATKAICKSLSYAAISTMFRVNTKELMKSEISLNNTKKVLADLVYKYISCFMIGFNTVYLLPNVFTILGIERPTFYTEM